jgi:hypothetical protein
VRKKAPNFHEQSLTVFILPGICEQKKSAREEATRTNCREYIGRFSKASRDLTICSLVSSNDSKDSSGCTLSSEQDIEPISTGDLWER